MKNLVFYALAVSMLASCNDEPDAVVNLSSDTQNNKPAINYSNKGDKYLSGVETTANAINNFLETIPNCNEDVTGKDNAAFCDTEVYSLHEELFPDIKQTIYTSQANVRLKTQLDIASTNSNPKILIIDSGVNSAALRHPKRMLAMYSWVSDLEADRFEIGYQHADEKLSISKAGYHIRKVILGNSDHFAPSSELTRTLNRDLIAKLPLGSANDVHGSLTLNLLADYIPMAQFVTLESFGAIAFPEEVICSRSDDYVDTYTNLAINALISIIKRHEIDYINLSAGLIRQDFKDSLISKCRLTTVESEDITRLQSAYVKILNSLAANAILVQAGPNGAANRIKTSAEGKNPEVENYADCLNIKNRLRTGFITQSYRNDGSLPLLISEGVSYIEQYDTLFRPSQLEIKGCIDAYFNTGWRERYLDLPSFGDYPILYSEDGITSGPLGSMYTSYVNGLGIATIEYIAREKSISREAALAILKEKKVDEDTPWLMDPMRYAELPVCMDFPNACKDWSSFSL